MNIISGIYNDNSIRVGIVASRFNEIIVSKLIDGAVDGLSRHGVDLDTVDLAWVPGAFEVPLTAQKMAQSGRYDAVICLGAVIRGETDHYEHVASEVTKGIAQVALRADIPILYGILTTDTVEQALNRAGLKAGNKGFECAMDAIELTNLFKKLKKLSVDISEKNYDNIEVKFLSMGMTGDYMVALEEGANFVRVGTGIFGKR